MSKEFIYGLIMESDPDTILYVGRSNNPERRLKEHLRESRSGHTKKCKVLNALIKQGESISYKVFEEVLLDSPSSAEDKWKVDLESDGHPLCNSKEGDMDRYVPLIEVDAIKEDWSADLLLDAEWKTKRQFSKSGLVTWIKGILFIRQGTSKLKMRHPNFGKIDIEGFGWEGKCKRAADMLTPGTEDAKYIRQQYEQSKRIRPSMYD